MNTIIDTAINTTVTIGTIGGIWFLFETLRDTYYERRWAKELFNNNEHISVEELKRILDRADGE